MSPNSHRLDGSFCSYLAGPIGETRAPRPKYTPAHSGSVVESTRITIPGYTGGCLTSGPVSLALEICIGAEGAAAGPFNLTVNGEHFARVDGIDAGDAVCVFGRYTYPSDTMIFLDDENEVEESDESNNESTRFVPIPRFLQTVPQRQRPTHGPVGRLQRRREARSMLILGAHGARARRRQQLPRS